MPEAAPREHSLARRLARMIAQGGPIPVSLFMALANGHYYATRDPLGADGDFTTAPEISQMFGELVGLWCADLWLRAGSPADAAWVELGGGRGTLAADALRSMARFGFSPDVHMVENSPVLRDMQAAATGAMAGVLRFHDDIASLPNDRPMIIIANEFFDALPIRQLVLTPGGWRERLVAARGLGFFPTIGDIAMDAAVPDPLRAAPPGTILETSPAGVAIAGDLAATVARQGGAMLVIDYGYLATAHGDTLQAVAGHAQADIFVRAGEQDLTAHVDFAALAAAARANGAAVHGPVTQGAFLNALGLAGRADALMATNSGRGAAIGAERDRLAAPEHMGQLFKAMAVTAPGWPVPEGFGG